jgi:L-alanine-DL-glutamate epimerase-like enolase superfamily enzyme
MRLGVHLERWEAIAPFRIAGRTWTEFESVVVELGIDGLVGRGEAMGVFYLGETPARIRDQIVEVAPRIQSGMDQATLQAILPPGGARNAVDCAFWDLECKRQRRRIWEIAGITPKVVETVYTIGIESTPEAMARKAAAATDHAILKVKLDAQNPLARLLAVRASRPDARIVVDANQSWSLRELKELAPRFADLGVEMIEQPLPRGEDHDLALYRSPVPLCADESCLTLDELDIAATRYQLINIKLDKTGGLTHALSLARAARDRGLGLMVGNMCGSSLALAPAVVIACLADLADVDGPLLQRWDRLPGLEYASGRVAPFGAALWG